MSSNSDEALASPVESHKEQRMANLRDASKRVSEFNKKMNGQYGVDSSHNSITSTLSDSKQFLVMNAKILAILFVIFAFVSAAIMNKLQPKCILMVDTRTQQIKINQIQLAKYSCFMSVVLLIAFVVMVMRMPEYRHKIFRCGELCTE